MGSQAYGSARRGPKGRTMGRNDGVETHTRPAARSSTMSINLCAIAPTFWRRPPGCKRQERLVDHQLHDVAISRTSPHPQAEGDIERLVAVAVGDPLDKEPPRPADRVEGATEGTKSASRVPAR